MAERTDAQRFADESRDTLRSIAPDDSYVTGVLMIWLGAVLMGALLMLVGMWMFPGSEEGQEQDAEVAQAAIDESGVG